MSVWEAGKARSDERGESNDRSILFYGLDQDEIPQRSGDDSFARRWEVPSDAWDAFALNELDQQELSSNNLPAVRGYSAFNVPALPARLSCFGTWIANVTCQPSAVWWAARQDSLHPDYRRSIERGLPRLHDKIDRGVQNLWEYLLEAWNNPPADSRRDWYKLKRDLEKDGWSLGGVRRFVKLSEPCLKVRPALMSRSVPPAADEEFRIFDLACIEVQCPVPPNDADVPVEWLHYLIQGLRTNLEAAARLHEEVDDYHRFHISPIAADDRSDISDYQRTHDFSGCVVSFASLYERLITVDAQRAREEFKAWPSNEGTAFARLRFWASGKREIATPEEFTQVILGLSDDVFWDTYHQRDLLIVLGARWAEVPDDDRQEIETRLLRGPSRYEDEDDSYTERIAWAVLERLQWLRTHECEFSFDVESEIARRRPDAPNWKPEYAEHAAESREMRGGWLVTDTEHGALIREPIDSILSKACELSGRSTTDSLREHDPFAGLCAERPKRAYLALAHEAARDEFPLWAWKTFLNSDSRQTDRSEFSAVIAIRLCRMPNEILSPLIYPASWWLQKVSNAMSIDFPEVFDRIIQRLLGVVKATPNIASSAMRASSREREWVTEAINSPVGHLVRAVFADARIERFTENDAGLAPIEQCLSLFGDPRRHAIAIASHHLAWLHARAADWTELHLLAIPYADDDEDREAFWAGFFWNPGVSSPELYLRIKDGLLTVATDETRSREGHAQSLAHLLLTGWVSSAGNEGRCCLNNSEFRDVLLRGGDELRSHVLWEFKRVLRSEKLERREVWQRRACEFFEEVWPRQRSVKSPQMTARLCEVLVARAESFAALIGVVSPLLTTIRDATGFHIHFEGEVKSVIQTHPERFLHLLHSVLPEDIRHWPYGINDALDVIAEADDSLLDDIRFCELRRRWNAR
jgi:hypothetical protein